MVRGAAVGLRHGALRGVIHFVPADLIRFPNLRVNR